jgi:hypothetical protein
MKLIVPPLKPGDRGDAVANLQDALLLLLEKEIIRASEEEHRALSDLIRSEQQGPLYTNGTAKAVHGFQEQH